MYNITVLCVGKLKEKFYIDASAEYCKRLSRYCKLNLLELKEERLPENPSPAQIESALSREADAIRAKLPQGADVVALCIEGRPPAKLWPGSWPIGAAAAPSTWHSSSAALSACIRPSSRQPGTGCPCRP